MQEKKQNMFKWERLKWSKKKTYKFQHDIILSFQFYSTTNAIRYSYANQRKNEADKRNTVTE